MKRRNYPYWRYSSFREWQIQARRQVRAALKATRVARSGCAFYPDGGATMADIEAKVQALHESMRPGVWK